MTFDCRTKRAAAPFELEVDLADLQERADIGPLYRGSRVPLPPPGSWLACLINVLLPMPVMPEGECASV